MLFFATAKVIEPNWQKLMAKVDEAQAPDTDQTVTSPAKEDESGPNLAKPKRTVDELMQDHPDMLDLCMKDLGLTQGKLLKIHAKLMMGCTMFATYTSSLSRSLYATDPDLVSTANHTEGSKHVLSQRQPLHRTPIRVVLLNQIQVAWRGWRRRSRSKKIILIDI
jgi:gamma-tubulin complex component 2